MPNEAKINVPAGPSEAKAAKRARGPRSPSYPALSLADAIEKVKILYEKDKRAPMREKVVLEHLGYGVQKSGLAGRVLSALRQFGLLDYSDDSYRISEAANQILHLSQENQTRVALIKRCALAPRIYKEILAKYPDGRPSDASLRDYLISEKKFNPASTESFIRAFKETLDLANLTPAEYFEGATSGGAGGNDEGDEMALNEVEEAPKPGITPAGTMIPPMSWVLSVPRGVKAELRIFGKDVRKDDLRRLKQQIEFLEESFEDDEEDQ